MKPVMFCRKTSGIFRCAAKLDEMRALQRRFRKQDSIVGKNADRIAENMRKAANKRGSVQRLELIEDAAIGDAGNDFAHVIGFARIGGHDAVNLLGIVKRFDGLAQHNAGLLGTIEGADDLPRDRKSASASLNA